MSNNLDYLLNMEQLVLYKRDIGSPLLSEDHMKRVIDDALHTLFIYNAELGGVGDWITLKDDDRRVFIGDRTSGQFRPPGPAKIKKSAKAGATVKAKIAGSVQGERIGPGKGEKEKGKKKDEKGQEPAKVGPGFDQGVSATGQTLAQVAVKVIEQEKQIAEPKPRAGISDKDKSSLLSKIGKEAQERDLNDSMRELTGVNIRSKNIPEKLGSKFDAHGVDTLKNLAELLDKGIDPNRQFFTERLGGKGYLLRDASNFIVLGSPGKTLRDGGIKAVIVDPLHTPNIKDLQKAFPQFKFIASKDTLSELEGMAKGEKIEPIVKQPKESAPKTPKLTKREIRAQEEETKRKEGIAQRAAVREAEFEQHLKKAAAKFAYEKSTFREGTTEQKREIFRQEYDKFIKDKARKVVDQTVKQQGNREEQLTSPVALEKPAEAPKKGRGRPPKYTPEQRETMAQEKAAAKQRLTEERTKVKAEKAAAKEKIAKEKAAAKEQKAQERAKIKAEKESAKEKVRQEKARAKEEKAKERERVKAEKAQAKEKLVKEKAEAKATAAKVKQEAKEALQRAKAEKAKEKSKTSKPKAEVKEKKPTKAQQAKAEKEAKEREAVEKAKKDQIEREAKEKVEKAKAEKERADREKLEKAQKEYKEKLERDKAEKLRKAQEKAAKDKEERKRTQEQQKQKEAERKEKERVERDRIEKEKAEKQRVEKERTEREAREKQEKARVEKQRIERERQEKERQEKEKADKERTERETREKAEKQKQEAEKQRIEKEKAEKAKAEIAKQAKEKVERETRERAERERQEKEAKDKAEAQKRVQEERERVEKERRDKADAERRESESREKIRAAQQKAEQERQTTEHKPHEELRKIREELDKEHDNAMEVFDKIAQGKEKEIGLIQQLQAQVYLAEMGAGKHAQKLEEHVIKDANKINKQDIGRSRGTHSKETKDTMDWLHKSIDSQDHLSEDHKSRYKEAVNGVLSRMPSSVANSLRNGAIKSTEWASHTGPGKGGTNEIWNKTVSKDKQVGDGSTVGGCFNLGTKRMMLDGGKDNKDRGKVEHTIDRAARSGGLAMAGTYAHEMTHAIDKHYGMISQTKEWKEIFDTEINSKGTTGRYWRLSDYAATKPVEGFAEFGRMVYGSDRQRSSIERDFPKAVALFKRYGMWM